MPTAIHVPGPAAIKVGASLSLLGYSVEGVTLDSNDLSEFIYADTGGGPNGMPVDEHDLGEMMTITANLVIYDEAVLATIRRRPAAAAEGSMPAAGTLIGAGGFYHRLLIQPPNGNLPYNFPTARLIRKAVRLSSRRNIWQLSWRAIAYIGTGTTAANVVLYNRATS